MKTRIDDTPARWSAFSIGYAGHSPHEGREQGMDMQNDRYLRIKDVREKTGLGTTTIYRKMGDGSFPKQIKIGERVAVWRESAINEWMTNQEKAA